MALVELRRVGKRFPNGVAALQDVTLDFEAGVVTAILGPSGAGKSTLLRTINGLETPTEGTITVDGIAVRPQTLRQVRRRVGMVFQHFNLVPRLSVMVNVLTGRLGYRSLFTSLTYLFPASDHELAIAALGKVGLMDKAWDRADRLSGGQQQRVGIARALVQQPKLILADEPVASLDPATSEDVMRLMVDVARSERVALVVNLHQVDLARDFCDRIVGLRGGRVVLDGPADSFSSDDLQSLYGGKP
jgi:phosphonate transport system ATP-binding protein